jgi:hypothetical protein
MIDEIRVNWIRPDRWCDLPLFETLEHIEVNGYAVPVGFITDGGSIPFGFRDNTNTPESGQTENFTET